jgi:hypothetical protein
MQLTRAEFHDFSQLRQFVSCTLCQQNDIELGVFQVTERVLTRRGRPCGIFFCLHGPRSVKLTAIWETERNTIRFYGSTGHKFQTTKLETSPTIAEHPQPI